MYGRNKLTGLSYIPCVHFFMFVYVVRTLTCTLAVFRYAIHYQLSTIAMRVYNRCLECFPSVSLQLYVI